MENGELRSGKALCGRPTAAPAIIAHYSAPRRRCKVYGDTCGVLYQSDAAKRRKILYKVQKFVQEYYMSATFAVY